MPQRTVVRRVCYKLLGHACCSMAPSLTTFVDSAFRTLCGLLHYANHRKPIIALGTREGVVQLHILSPGAYVQKTRGSRGLMRVKFRPSSALQQHPPTAAAAALDPAPSLGCI
jgi:hypothetical protein